MTSITDRTAQTAETISDTRTFYNIYKIPITDTKPDQDFSQPFPSLTDIA